MCYVIAQSKRKVSGNLIIENWAENRKKGWAQAGRWLGGFVMKL